MAIDLAPRSTLEGDRYEIKSRLGSGPFGSTFWVRDLSVPQKTEKCIKLVNLERLAEALGQSVEMTRRCMGDEVVLADDMYHERVARLFGHFSETVRTRAGDEIPCFALVTQLCPGGNLSKLIHGPPYGAERAVRLALQVAEALAYAHGRSPSVVHGDLNLHHVCLDGSGDAIVVDWSGAWTTFLTLLLQQPRDNPTMGSPWYYSPERLDRGRVSRDDDVWAWGLLALQLLLQRVEKKIYRGDAVAEARRDLDPVLEEAKARHPVLGGLIERALSVERRERPRAAQIVETLQLSLLGRSGVLPGSVGDPAAVDYAGLEAGGGGRGGAGDGGREKPGEGHRRPGSSAEEEKKSERGPRRGGAEASTSSGEDDPVARVMHNGDGASEGRAAERTEDEEREERAKRKTAKDFAAARRQRQGAEERARRAAAAATVARANATRARAEAGLLARLCGCFDDRVLAMEEAALTAEAQKREADQRVVELTDTEHRFPLIVRLHPKLRLQGHTGHVTALARHPTRRLLASGGIVPDDCVHIWDLDTGRDVGFMTASTGTINALEFNPSGDQVAAGCSDATVRVWSTSGETPLVATLEGHTDGVRALAWRKSNPAAGPPLLASGSRDHTIRVWEVATGRPRFVLSGHSESVNALTSHPTQDLLASASSDMSVRLWAWATGAAVRVLVGHTESVHALASTADRVFSGSADRTVRVWRWDRDDCERVLEGHTEELGPNALAVNGAETILASRDSYGGVRLWDIGALFYIGALTAAHAPASIACGLGEEVIFPSKDNWAVLEVWSV